MDFYQYVSKKIPNFETIFTTKEIEEIKILFDEYLFYNQARNTNLSIENGNVRNAQKKLDAKIEEVIETHLQVFSHMTPIR